MNNYDGSQLLFQNLQEKNMTFEHVFSRIIRFMNLSHNGNYRLMIGTDSQVHERQTVFITGIVILNERKGAWACIRKVGVPRRMDRVA